MPGGIVQGQTKRGITMKRTGWNNAWRIAGLLLALAALSLGPRPQAASATGLYSDTFEDSLKPWTEGAGSFLTLDYSDNVCPLEHGTGMALLAIPVRGPNVTGRLDEIGAGFAYMGANFPASSGDT